MADEALGTFARQGLFREDLLNAVMDRLEDDLAVPDDEAVGAVLDASSGATFAASKPIGPASGWVRDGKFDGEKVSGRRRGYPVHPSGGAEMPDRPLPRMPLVAADVIEGWEDPEIEAFFRHSYVLGTPPPTSLSLDAHNPTALRAFRRFWWSTFHNGFVPHRLKELLRIQIARHRDCDY